MTNCLLLRFSQSGKHDVQTTHRSHRKHSSHPQNTIDNHWLFFFLSSQKKKKEYKSVKAPRKKRGGKNKFDACLIVATLRIMLSLLPASTSFTPSHASPLVLHASSLGSTIPPGGTLFHSHPDVKWVAAGSMGAQGASAVGCSVAPWESSAAFSTGVAWVDEDEENGNGRDGR